MYLFGIDVGTSSIKVAVVGVQTQKALQRFIVPSIQAHFFASIIIAFNTN